MNDSSSSKKNYTFIIYFALLSTLIYGLKIHPILFNDDWCHLANIQSSHFSMLTERRPLHSIVMWSLLKLFPAAQGVILNYYVQVLLLYLTTLSVFFLGREIFRQNTLPAFLVASLYLVYPNDYTQLYITTSGIRLSLFLLFISMILFARVFQNQTRREYWWIIPLLLLSFLMYEGQLGLALVWPIALFILFPQKITREKLLDIFLYYIPMFVFVIWRLFIQPRFYADNKLAYLSVIDLKEIIRGYVDAVRIIYAGFAFPYNNSTWLTTPNLLITGTIFLFLGLGYLLLKRQTPSFAVQNTSKPSDIYQLIYILIIGGLLWVAGYFPIILNYPPNIYGHLSRVNMFSIIGAAIIFTSGLMLVFEILKLKTNLAASTLSIITLAFVFWGAIIQIQVQEAYNNAWKDTQLFYHALFEKVPNIKDESQVILLFNGYDNNDGITRPVFSTSWEPACVFEALYEKEDVDIYYRYDKRKIPDFPRENSLTSTLYTNTIEPIDDLSKLIVLKYDKPTSTLSIENKIKPFQSEGSFGEYSPEDRIIPLENPILNRELVQ